MVLNGQHSWTKTNQFQKDEKKVKQEMLNSSTATNYYEA